MVVKLLDNHGSLYTFYEVIAKKINWTTQKVVCVQLFDFLSV